MGGGAEYLYQAHRGMGDDLEHSVFGPGLSDHDGNPDGFASSDVVSSTGAIAVSNTSSSTPDFTPSALPSSTCTVMETTAGDPNLTQISSISFNTPSDQNTTTTPKQPLSPPSYSSSSSFTRLPDSTGFSTASSAQIYTNERFSSSQLRSGSAYIRCHLDSCNGSNLIIQDCTLDSCNVRKSQISGTRCDSCNLGNCSLRECSLGSCNVTGDNVRGCTHSSSNFH